jgi:peptidyl-prolyl cis-trans isomerase C
MLIMQLKPTLSALAIATLLAFGCDQASSQTAAAAQRPAAGAPAKAVNIHNVLHQTLITVNGEPITAEMFGIYFSQRLQKMPGARPTAQLQNQAVNELVNILLLAQAARKQHLDTNPQIELAVELQRKELLSRVALQEEAAKTKPSEDDLKKAYEAEYGKPHEEYKAQHILVKTEDEAKKIIEDLGKGADFTALAKKSSIDPAGKNGGELGWFGTSQMVKPFSAAVATMKVGSISSEPVKTQFGWHVIRLEDKRKATPPTFAEVKNRLIMEAQRKALTKYVAELHKEAKIEVNASIAKKISHPGTSVMTPAGHTPK